MISGGEKQRLAVARLLLKDSPILFFDEAVSCVSRRASRATTSDACLTFQTSALDTYTEADVMRNINNTLLDRKRTSIFVAHRLKTISDAGQSLSATLDCLHTIGNRLSIRFLLLLCTQISSSCSKTVRSLNKAPTRSCSGVRVCTRLYGELSRRKRPWNQSWT